MSDRPTEALARSLCPRVTEPGYCDKCERTAEHVLTDPGPLLAALHQAGILHRQTRRQHRGGPREARYATIDPDGRVDDGDGMATSWTELHDHAQAAEGQAVTDPTTLAVDDIIHIRWRGIDRDYRVRRIDDGTITATYHDDGGIGSAVLPFDRWGEHLGDPVVVTLVKNAPR